MKGKILNLLLALTSLLGYLEWSGDSHSFLFQAEGEVLAKIFTDPASVVHPLILIPLAGQLLLIFTLFQKKPGKWLTFLSMAGLGVLLGFILLVGVLALNVKIVLSTLPFFIVAFATIRHYRK